MSDWYELIGQTPVRIEGDILTKALSFEHADRRVALMFYGAHNDPAAVRKWIEGFN